MRDALDFDFTENSVLMVSSDILSLASVSVLRLFLHEHFCFGGQLPTGGAPHLYDSNMQMCFHLSFAKWGEITRLVYFSNRPFKLGESDFGP